MESWLSDLGVRYSSLESDFSNGYIIGSILYRYSLQDDFGLFSTKPNYANSNLAKVKSTLERLNIKLNIPQLASNDPVYISKLLTQIYNALHNVTFTSLKPVRGKSAVSMARSSKTELLESALKKYDEVRVQQSEKALKEEKKQMEAIRQGYLDERKKQIDVLKSNKLFMQQWETEGRKNWSKNQMRKTARVKHEEKVGNKIANECVQRKVEYKADHCNQVADGIKEFERNMIRLGIDHPPDAKEVKKKKVDLKTEALVTMAKIVERKNVNMQATKEREVRQRNMIVEQRKNLKFDTYKKGSARVWVVLVAVIKNQYLIGLENLKRYVKRVKSFSMSIKNTEEYARKTQAVWGKIENDRRFLLSETEKEKKKHLSSEKLQIRKNILSHQKAQYANHTEICSSIMSLILSIADEGSSFLETHNKIPEQLWNQWMFLFKDNKPPDFKIPLALLGKTDNMQELMNLTFSSALEASEQQINEYIHCKNSWDYIESPNNYLLGDILETIIPIAYPDDPDPPLPEGPSYLPLKILLLGPPFSGKKTQAKRLFDNYGIKSLEIPKIIEDAKKVVQRKVDQEENKKKKVQEDEPDVFVQACLETTGEDEFGRSRLIRARIRGIFGDVQKLEEEVKKVQKKDEVKCLGYLLMNYPTNIREATDLERHMSNFLHPSELPEPISAVKKREARSLARPSKKPKGPKKMFRSAWDLVILLDVDLQICVTRAVDRRVDPAGNVYNLSYNPPPDNILAKCKVIEHPNQSEVTEMYQEFAINKDMMIHWFSQFGIEYECNLLHIKGNSNIEHTWDSIKARVNDILRVKSTPAVTPSASKREINGIHGEQAKELVYDWELMKKNYFLQISYALAHGNQHTISCLKHIHDKKQEFLDFLYMPDQKSQLFIDFREKLYTMIKSKAIFTSSEIQGVHQQIEDLLDNIWDVTIQRKDSALIKREEILTSSSLQQEIAGVLHITLLLLQAELRKHYSSVNLMEKYNCFLQRSQFVERTPPELSIRWFEWTNETIGEPLLKDLIQKAKAAALNIQEFREEFELFLKRIENIQYFARETIKKYTSLTQKLFESLDLWICRAVILENTAMNRMVDLLRKAFETRVLEETVPYPSNYEILDELDEELAKN